MPPTGGPCWAGELWVRADASLRASRIWPRVDPDTDPAPHFLMYSDCCRCTSLDGPQARPYAVDMEGSVEWFNSDRGYGFLAPDGGGADVYVYFSQIQAVPQTLTAGQRVSFDIEDGQKGPLATQVIPLT